jgi:hypothetical protein
MTSPTPDRPSPADIADLLAWARSLSQAGPGPAERAAYQNAKTTLLARIADQHTDTDTTRDTQ